MLTFDQARSLLSRLAVPIPPVKMNTTDALGFRIAEPPVSDVAAPPMDVSAMDGYAVRYADISAGGPWTVCFEISAGKVSRALPLGQVARIFTGAVLPEGADTVVQQEMAHIEADGRVGFDQGITRGDHVRRGGEVMGPGTHLASVGDAVTPQRVSALAAGGAHRIVVHPRPRVAVVITGSELVPVTAIPGPGQIRNSNGPLLNALVRASGCETPAEFSAEDEEGALSTSIKNALDAAEIVLTSGGVSVGDYDLVPDVVRSLGGEIVFHRVAVKPGKPILAARIGSQWVIGLPGNPVSVLAGWRMFGLPLVSALAGDPGAFNEIPRRGTLVEGVDVRGGREEFRPATLSGDGDLRVVPWKGSHDLLAAAGANVLARLQPRRRHQAGEDVPCYPI